MALKEILKWPLIVAAIVVVLRVIVERAGAPAAVSNMLSVAAMTTVLGPLYFALQFGLAAEARRWLPAAQSDSSHSLTCARAGKQLELQFGPRPCVQRRGAFIYLPAES